MIIMQDARLKDELPKVFEEKFSKYLEDITEIDDIKLEKILGFKYPVLENALKEKLRGIKVQYPDYNLQKTFQRLHEEEKSWWQRFLPFVSRIFSLNEQKKLLNEILDDLPEAMKETLQDDIKAQE